MNIHPIMQQAIRPARPVASSEAENIALRKRLRALVPDVELDTSTSSDPQQATYAAVPPHIVEEAVIRLVDESGERLEELCAEICTREAQS